MIPKRGRTFGANADMSDVKCAHIPKFNLSNLKDEELAKLLRLAEKIQMRKNIKKYVFGQK